MEKIFKNMNGQTYYILFGGIGKRSFLCNLFDNENAKYVICAILEENSWWQGSYFNDFKKHKYWED